MNSTDRIESGRDQDIVPVYNRSTGQVFYCQMNRETQTYEVVASTTPTLKVLNLQAKFSKVCSKTFKVIVYARDIVTEKLGKYIFENNDFKSAPDCRCESCKINVQEIGDNKSIFRSSNGSSLILIGVLWFGCHLRGKCTTFVDPSTGIIGEYKRAINGDLVMAKENMMIKMFPSKELSEPLNHHFINVRYCPHIEQSVYICARGSEKLYLTFNRRHLRFELINCGCDFQDLMITVDEGEKLIDEFSSVQYGVHIGIFCSLQQKLVWKEFDEKSGSWFDRSSNAKVLDCRDLSTRDLLIRYNFNQIDQEPFLDALDESNNRKLVFIEPSPYGRVYWMLNKFCEIHPYRYQETDDFTLSKQLQRLCQIKLFHNRKNAQSVFEGKTIKHRSYRSLTEEFTSHICEKCKNNPKSKYDTEKSSINPYSKLPHIQEFFDRYSDKQMSPPSFPAPPPPPMDQKTQQLVDAMRGWRAEYSDLLTEMPNFEPNKAHILTKLRQHTPIANLPLPQQPLPTANSFILPTHPISIPPPPPISTLPVKPLYDPYQNLFNLSPCPFMGVSPAVNLLPPSYANPYTTNGITPSSSSHTIGIQSPVTSAPAIPPTIGQIPGLAESNGILSFTPVAEPSNVAPVHPIIPPKPRNYQDLLTGINRTNERLRNILQKPVSASTSAAISRDLHNGFMRTAKRMRDDQEETMPTRLEDSSEPQTYLPYPVAAEGSSSCSSSSDEDLLDEEFSDEEEDHTESDHDDDEAALKTILESLQNRLNMDVTHVD